ncbi:FHA domain-containing protein [Runella sp.]|uniref:FHA domain-containing protein n=1 Tax=Runella sp. TaxID=1960881 RepID=UPI003D0B03F5
MNEEKPLPELQQITIGRAEENTIVLSPGNIGRRHAILTVCSPNTYLLEDLDSKHGTYVNKDRIKRKFVSAEDEIVFATHSYLLKQLLVMVGLMEKEKDKDDFTEEFEKMKELYEQYLTFKSNEVHIQSAIKKMNDKLRMAGVLTAPTLAGLTFLLGGPAIITIISGCGLISLIPTLGSKFLKLDEKLEQPRLYFANNWKCPKCDDKIQFLNKSWDMLARQKRCGKCNAVWVK